MLTVDSFFYKSIQIYSQKVESVEVDSFFQHFFHNNDTRSTMSEPAKDTAIEITPKPQASSVRVPRIVAEINRVASRVRDRNKKKKKTTMMPKFWKTTHLRRRKNLWILRLYGRIHTIVGGSV